MGTKNAPPKKLKGCFFARRFPVVPEVVI